MPWDPQSGQTFGEHMRGGQPLGNRTADVITDEPTYLTKDQVQERRGENGSFYKATRDQAGHITTLETTADGRERKHVRIGLR
ncbi:hypothetical protein [Streptosporangium sp. NPDC049078]|uniref:hypothetical protein n=1 Tax=Streptosporangium sp. NPDC049078 TaxID=3155767 RepID=UPI00341B5D96